MLPHDGGSVPLMLFLLRFNCRILRMFPHEGRRVPAMVLCCRLIEKMSSPRQLIPYQSHIGTEVSPHPLLLIHPVVLMKKFVRRA
jgi:hypothetical protein